MKASYLEKIVELNPRRRRETRYNPGLVFDPVNKRIVWPDNKRISTLTASLISTTVPEEKSSTASNLKAIASKDSTHYEDFSSISVEFLETNRNSITPPSVIKMTEKEDIYTRELQID